MQDRASTPQVIQARFVAIAGDEQSGVVERPLEKPFVVEVRDGTGQGIPGVPVTFTVTKRQGTLAPAAPQFTDALGRAAVVLTLGTRKGANEVTVTSPGNPGLASLTFTATGQADRNNAMPFIVSGNNQVAAPGEELPEPLVVRLEAAV